MFSDPHKYVMVCVHVAIVSNSVKINESTPLPDYSLSIQEGAPMFNLIQIQNNLFYTFCLPYLSELAININITLVDLLLRVAEKVFY